MRTRLPPAGDRATADMRGGQPGPACNSRHCTRAFRPSIATKKDPYEIIGGRPLVNVTIAGHALKLAKLCLSHSLHAFDKIVYN